MNHLTQGKDRPIVTLAANSYKTAFYENQTIPTIPSKKAFRVGNNHHVDTTILLNL